MIGPADDFLIHQTPEPVRYPQTSDRRFYDRHFLTGHACGEHGIFFLLGVGAYPNLGVMDGFVSVAVGGAQHATRGSRELGNDRMDTAAIGPISLEVLEPLERLRFRCEPTETGGVSLDLTWVGAVEAFDEPPIFNRVLGRVMEAGTRIIQTGTYEGFIEVAGQRFEVTPDTWWGARDRSWGVRSIGLEREPKGIQQARRDSAPRAPLWIWSPMQFEHETVHFSMDEHADGRRDIVTLRRMTAEGGVEELGGNDHALILDPSTRELKDGSQVSWDAADGARRTVTLTPLCSAYLRGGTGYGGPDPWRHGAYMGHEPWEGSVSFDLTDQAVAAKIGPTHVCCRMELDTGEIGYGTFETQVFGAFPKYGFST